MQTRSSQQANHSAQLAESQTSLNNAKTILSQVLNNLNQSNVSSNQPFPTTAYGDNSLRQSDFMPLQYPSGSAQQIPKSVN